MVNQGFDTDWKVKQQLDWLQTKKETEKSKFLTVCVHSWICKMGGVPLTAEGKIPKIANGWHSLVTKFDKVAEISGLNVGCDLSSFCKGLAIVFEKADSTTECNGSFPLSGTVRYSTVRNYVRFHCQKLWMVPK